MPGLFQDPKFMQGLSSLMQSGPSTTPQPFNWQALANLIGPQQNQANPMPAQTGNMMNPAAYIPSAFGNQSQSQPQAQAQAQTLNQPGPMSMSPTQDLGSIRSLQQAAIAAYPDNPIMQQVALSQAVLESGLPGHMSKLATQGNNLFGIKASRTAPGTGGNASMQTTEYVNGVPMTSRLPFSQNNSIADSFAQHRDLLTKLNRYSPVMRASSPNEAFGALQKAGYATDPNYAKKLNRVYSTWVKPLYET